jgi:hypothetical protein
VSVPVIVTFTIIHTANGCQGAPITATLQVNPKALINPDPILVTICNSGTFSVTPVDGTNGVVPAGTTYSWAVYSITGGITGAESGSGTTISGTLNNPSILRKR